MRSRGDTAGIRRAVLSAVLGCCALGAGGCAAWREGDDAPPPKKKSEVGDFRPRGKADLPFWYSSKSRDIEESLGGTGH
ncbi:MAG: hypothetical protein AB7O62_24425 [Pirellulales bacterium]